MSLNNEVGDQEDRKPVVIGKPNPYGLKAIMNDCKSKSIAIVSGSEFAEDDQEMSYRAQTDCFALTSEAGKSQLIQLNKQA